MCVPKYGENYNLTRKTAKALKPHRAKHIFTYVYCAGFKTYITVLLLLNMKNA